MFAQTNDENYFAGVGNMKNIECIFSANEMTVNYCENGLRAKRNCTVCAERTDFKDVIQLRLTDNADQRRMYITTVDSASFHELKQDQSLHVTFSGFVENLMRMLQDCQQSKLELNLIRNEQASPLNGSIAVDMNTTYHQIQFVEMRSFKNLVHLCLPCRAAPLNVVLFYVNKTLEEVNKKTAFQEQICRQLKLDMKEQQRHVELLDAENKNLRDSIAENSRVLNERHSEQMNKMQDKLHELSEQRNNDAERSRKTISALQAQLNKLTLERSNLQKEKEQEARHIEKLKEELASSKTRMCTLKEQNENLYTDINALKLCERKQESNLEDARRQLAELHDKLKQCAKDKANVMAELEAERNILHTKRHALEMASEEIAKANQIIFKQNQELIKLKTTTDLRTEVALQQEKAIKEKEMQLSLMEEEANHLRKTIESLQEAIPQQLDSMRNFAHSLELKYTNEIKLLKARLTEADSGKENHVDANVLRHTSVRRK